MNLNISAWSIRNPTPAILFFLLLTFGGLLGFSAMKIQNFPDFDFPVVTVSLALPGASPVQLENDVVRKIEDSLATVQGIKHIRSNLTDSSATISVEFQLEKNIQEAVDDVRDAVARVRADLPADLRDPVISKIDFAGETILTFTVASNNMDEEALSWFVDNQITRLIRSVPGVGSASRFGGVTREIRIELDPHQLLAFNATAADISRQLRQMQQDASGGRTDLGDSEQLIRTIASVQTADELATMEITLSDGRRIRLNQIANVQDTVAEQRSAALLNGKPVVGFDIVRARGFGEVDVMYGVRDALEKLKTRHPDIVITEVFNAVNPVEENYQGSMNLLYEGAILAVLVVFLFLRDWRATFISAAALPLSVIPAFGLMHLLGFTLNTVSLLSLSLVIGMLVDDAIVEIENIMRHLRMGKTPYQAAMEAADEIGLAVIATSFTLVAVFLPTAFMGGVAGKFFVQFGWTAAIAVIFSLLVARMLTPMMAAYMLKPSIKNNDETEPRWRVYYMKWMQRCLTNRRTTLLAATVFFIGSFAILPFLPTGFIPADDVPQTRVAITLPPGSTFSQTYLSAEQARDIIKQNPHVKSIYTTIGNGGRGTDPFSGGIAPEVRYASLTLNLSQRRERTGISRLHIENQLRQALLDLPGARVKVGTEESENYVLVLAGEDATALGRSAQKVEREIRAIPGIGSVTSSASLVRPELIVRPDFTRAADLGVNSADIAETLRVATSGDYDFNLAKLNLSERQVPIVIKLTDIARTDLDTLKRLPVKGARGPVPLENVATLEIGSGPADITRYDRTRNVNIQVELNSLPLGDVEHAILALPSLNNLPPGITHNNSGDAEMMGELFAGFSLAMLTGVFCIYIVLVLLFKDFIQPITILAALFLSIPGAFFALFVTQSALSMPSMIGLIMLMGIATKNSILLIDYIVLARREHGLNRWDAVVDACRKRARPIIMTTIAMGAGMLPLALGWGADPSFRAPMAVVVIGGLISSTFLSLLVIPVVFTYIDDAISFIAISSKNDMGLFDAERAQ